jgi:hypothetical protein
VRRTGALGRQRARPHGTGHGRGARPEVTEFCEVMRPELLAALRIRRAPKPCCPCKSGWSGSSLLGDLAVHTRGEKFAGEIVERVSEPAEPGGGIAQRGWQSPAALGRRLQTTTPLCWQWVILRSPRGGPNAHPYLLLVVGGRRGAGRTDRPLPWLGTYPAPYADPHDGCDYTVICSTQHGCWHSSCSFAFLLRRASNRVRGHARQGHAGGCFALPAV